MKRHPAQPTLFAVEELPDPAPSFRRETAQERRWRQRQEAARKQHDRAWTRAIKTPAPELDHDARWARPHSGYRVETIRDPRLDGDGSC